MTLGGFDPDTYPGWRPDGAVLVRDCRLHDVDPDEVTGGRTGASVPDPAALRWSVAHGSNACPDRVVDKGLDRNGALLLPARVTGWAPAFESRRVPSHGAVPVTLVPAEGDHPVWVLGIHAADVARLDASEGRNERYLIGQVGPVTVAGRWRLDRLPAYGPIHGTRVLLDGGRPARWPHRDQAWAARRFDAGGASAPVRPLPDVVERGWPASGRGVLAGDRSG